MRSLIFVFLLWAGFINAQSRKLVGNEEFPQKKEGKAMVMLFYTDWCSVCRLQERQLETLQMANKNTDWVILNPETYKKDLYFLGKKYRYISNGTGGLHRLAYELAGQQSPNYPFWVFVDEKNKTSTYEGFLKKQELVDILR